MSSYINPNIPSIQSLDDIKDEIAKVSSGITARGKKGLLRGYDVRLYLVGNEIQAMTTKKAKKAMKIDKKLEQPSDSKRVKEINQNTISVLDQLVNPTRINVEWNTLQHKLKWLNRKAEKEGAVPEAILELQTQQIKERIDDAFSYARRLRVSDFEKICNASRQAEAVSQRAKSIEDLKIKSNNVGLPNAIVSAMENLGFNYWGRRDVEFFKNSEVTQHFIHKALDYEELVGRSDRSAIGGDPEVTTALIQKFIKDVYGIELKLP